MCCTESYCTRRKKALNTRHQAKKGFRGIFIGIPNNQKGFIVYVTHTRKIISSYGIFFMKFIIVRYPLHHNHIQKRWLCVCLWHIHPMIYRIEAHYKIRDPIRQRQQEWKVALKATKNIGKCLHKVFKTVVKEISQDLPPLGESSSGFFISFQNP